MVITDEKMIAAYMNILTMLFSGRCLDTFSDVKKVYEIREIMSDENLNRLAIISFLSANDDIRIGMFRMERESLLKEWKKTASMTFATTTIETAAEMIKTPQVLFGANRRWVAYEHNDMFLYN